MTMDDMMKASMARLNEIGNKAILGAQQNSERLSAMMGIRAAQTNPIEAHAIGKLDQSAQIGNSSASALVSALAALFANQAHNSPTTAK